MFKDRFRFYSKILISTAISLAAIILFAWTFHLDSIKSIFPNTTTMNPTSSVCFILIGISFLICHSSLRKTRWYTLALSFSIIPILIGTLRIFDFTWGLQLGIDGMLFPNELQSEVPGVLSNRMAFNTALSFILLGSAVLLSSSQKKILCMSANHLTIIALFISLFSCIGYFYQVEEFRGILLYIPMSFQSAIAFLLTGLAILSMNNEHGFMAVVTSSHSGGTLARILIPAAILAPIVIGYVRLMGQKHTPITDELGVALLITFIAILFFLLILLVSFIVNNKDIERKEVEVQLAKANQDLEKKVEERSREIHRNENRYRSLIENSFEGISLVDENLNSLYQSPGVKLITGYGPGERKQIDSSNNIHPEDQSKATQLFALLLKEPNVGKSFSYRVRHKSKGYIWLEGTAINLLGDEDVKAIVINYRDITERKAYETKLAASEQGLRAIMESSEDAYAITTKDLSSIYQSPSAERITGISLTYRLAHPEMRYTHPEDMVLLKNLVVELLAHPEKPLPFQTRFLHASGNYIWIEGTMSNLLHDPNVNGLTFHYRDVTDRKKLEEQQAANEARFRALIENISDAIVLNDENSNILYQSPSVTRILGYEIDERKGKPVLDYIHPDNREMFIKLYKDLAATSGKTFPFQYRFLHKQGNYIWLEGFVTNLLNDPTVRAYVANYRDITERKDSEEKILTLNSQLEERVNLRTIQLQAANREMEAFTYSVSHDLRAPLRIINGFSQILKEDYANKIDAEGQNVLERIMKNSKRMGQLMDDLLNFSRLGKSEITASEISMNKIVVEVLEELASSGVTIPKEFYIPDLPPAYGDFNLMKQVWSNLLANAIKYSSKKEHPKIEVGATKGKGETIYFIKDNGDGFDMQYYSKLFGVFQRLHKESEFAGTGVGLALVQRIVLRHGGRVWAEGKPGEGAAFYFQVPNARP